MDKYHHSGHRNNRQSEDTRRDAYADTVTLVFDEDADVEIDILSIFNDIEID